jgi:hypothetical protein
MTEAFTIGPFKDGIRLGMLSAPDSITDATDIINFDILNDGTLRSRRMQRIIPDKNGTTKRMEMLAAFYDSAGKPYIIASCPTGTYQWDGTANFTQITTNVAVDAVQYMGYIWLVCETGASGKWKPVEGFTAVSGMPLGRSCVVKNDRMLIAKVGTDAAVYYSKAGDFNSWEGAGGGYFQVRKDDGGQLQKLLIYNDQVLVFKNSGLWALSFTGDPGAGNLRLVSPHIGTANRISAVAREDIVMFYHDGKIYGMNNNQLIDLGRPLMEDFNVNFPTGVGTPATPSGAMNPLTVNNLFLTFFEHNKILAHIDGFNYVYHIESGSWTRYDFGANTIGRVLQIRTWSDAAEWVWYAGARDVNDDKIYQFMHPEIAGDTAGMTLLPFNCRVRTKGLIFGNPTAFKRLFHWGIDCSFAGAVTATIYPIATETPATWAQIATRKWSELAQWKQPLGYSANTVVDSSSDTYTQRTYTKFPRSLRFRRAEFQVDFTRNKDYCLLYTITVFAAVKQLVFAKET